MTMEDVKILLDRDLKGLDNKELLIIIDEFKQVINLYNKQLKKEKSNNKVLKARIIKLETAIDEALKQLNIVGFIQGAGKVERAKAVLIEVKNE